MTTPRWSTWWLKLDARNRAWRATLQGLVLTVLTAVGDAGYQVLQRALDQAKVTGAVDWTDVRGSIARAAMFAAGMGLLAYVHRRFIDPSRVPSAAPPLPPGVAPSAAPATRRPA